MSDEHKDNKPSRKDRELAAQIDKDNLRVIIGVSALLILTLWAGLTLPV